MGRFLSVSSQKSIRYIEATKPFFVQFKDLMIDDRHKEQQMFTKKGLKMLEYSRSGSISREYAYVTFSVIHAVIALGKKVFISRVYVLIAHKMSASG